MEINKVARHWIAGDWSSAGPKKESVNPATGQIIGAYFDATSETAHEAINAAATAFETAAWRAHPMVRAAALHALAEEFTKRTDDVIDSLCLENGKLRAEATFEATAIPRALRFAAGLATQLFGRVLDPVPGKQSMSIRQPVGVAGLIIPWNAPSEKSADDQLHGKHKDWEAHRCSRRGRIEARRLGAWRKNASPGI